MLVPCFELGKAKIGRLLESKNWQYLGLEVKNVRQIYFFILSNSWPRYGQCVLSTSLNAWLKSPLRKISVPLTLPPTAYRILWLLRLKNPPLRYHGRSHFGLYITIDHLLTKAYRGPMPKFGLKSQKFKEIWRFANF